MRRFPVARDASKKSYRSPPVNVTEGETNNLFRKMYKVRHNTRRMSQVTPLLFQLVAFTFAFTTVVPLNTWKCDFRRQGAARRHCGHPPIGVRKGAASSS